MADWEHGCGTGREGFAYGRGFDGIAATLRIQPDAGMFSRPGGDCRRIFLCDLEERLAERELRSGEGLWLNPFHGIPMTGLASPLDLIYLDEECRVIEAVESYPTFLASPSCPRATSVLVLPAHSIYSSQTQKDDQLVLCVAEEMEGRLERISSAGRRAISDEDDRSARGGPATGTAALERGAWTAGIGDAFRRTAQTKLPRRTR